VRGLRTLAALAMRGAALLALCGVLFLPFYLAAGDRCLGFLTYHRSRPLEINSLLGSLLLLPRLFGQVVPVEYTYGSINVCSPLVPTLVGLAPWLGVGLLLAATAGLLVHFRRLAVRAGEEAHGNTTLAQLYPGDVVAFALLFWMLFVLTNKVFSTQYLLWMAPLVALLPLAPRSRRLFSGCFLLICLLSTVLVPFLFVSDLIDPAAAPTVPRTFKAPTSRIVAVLAVRNLLLVALSGALAFWCGYQSGAVTTSRAKR
jgi:hypothetical protein